MEGNIPINFTEVILRIIQLIQKRQRRGAEIFSLQLSHELVLLGHQVMIVSIFSHSPDLESEQIQIISLERPLNVRLFDPKGYQELYRIISSFKPDLVQANAADTLKYAVISKIFFRWKAKLVYRNANQMGDFISSGLQKYLYTKLLSQVDAVASVSKASKENFHATFPKFQKEVAYLPIGIPVDFFENDSNLPESLHGKKFLLQVGGLVKEKNPLFSLEVFESLAVDFPDINMVFLGSGSLESILSEKIRHSAFQSRIFLIPNQPSVKPFLDAAYALLMPSFIEGLPAVILEAMASGTLVIAYDVGGISEIVQNNSTGFLIPKGDNDNFKASLMMLLNMGDKDRERIKETAKKLVLLRYGLPALAKEFEIFYKRLNHSIA